MISHFKATAIEFQFPVLLIVTSDPPSPLLLTVASVAAAFIPPRQPVNNANFEARLIPDVRPLSVTTNYAGPRCPTDPLDFTFSKWTEPTEPQLKALFAALAFFCNPRRIHILCPNLIIELHVNDERLYKPNSLPQRIGGFAVFYHHSQESVFGGLSVQGRERLLVPSGSVQDTTDYIQTSNALCPGIPVQSAQATDVGPYAEIAISTTAGVLLRDKNGPQYAIMVLSIAVKFSIHLIAALKSERLTNVGRHSTLLWLSSTPQSHLQTKSTLKPKYQDASCVQMKSPWEPSSVSM